MPISEMHRSLLQEPVRKGLLAFTQLLQEQLTLLAGQSGCPTLQAAGKGCVSWRCHWQHTARCAVHLGLAAGTWHMSAEIPLAVRDSLSAFFVWYLIMPPNKLYSADKKPKKINSHLIDWGHWFRWYLLPEQYFPSDIRMQQRQCLSYWPFSVTWHFGVRCCLKGDCSPQCAGWLDKKWVTVVKGTNF